MISLGLAERGLMPYKNAMAQMGRNTDLSLVMLKSLESLFPAFEQQILRMEKGGGAILYPQPLPSHPDSPKETISILNPCHACNL